MDRAALGGGGGGRSRRSHPQGPGRGATRPDGARRARRSAGPGGAGPGFPGRGPPRRGPPGGRPAPPRGRGGRGMDAPPPPVPAGDDPDEADGDSIVTDESSAFGERGAPDNVDDDF